MFRSSAPLRYTVSSVASVCLLTLIAAMSPGYTSSSGLVAVRRRSAYNWNVGVRLEPVTTGG
jgi:hypothetical protein